MGEKEEYSNMKEQCVQSQEKVPWVINKGVGEKLCLGILQEFLESSVSLSNSQIWKQSANAQGLLQCGITGLLGMFGIVVKWTWAGSDREGKDSGHD